MERVVAYLGPTNQRPCCDLWTGWSPAPGIRECRTASRCDPSASWRSQSPWSSGGRRDPAAGSPASDPGTPRSERAGNPMRTRSPTCRNYLICIIQSKRSIDITRSIFMQISWWIYRWIARSKLYRTSFGSNSIRQRVRMQIDLNHWSVKRWRALYRQFTAKRLVQSSSTQKQKRALTQDLSNGTT